MDRRGRLRAMEEDHESRRPSSFSRRMSGSRQPPSRRFVRKVGEPRSPACPTGACLWRPTSSSSPTRRSRLSLRRSVTPTPSRSVRPSSASAVHPRGTTETATPPDRDGSGGARSLASGSSGYGMRPEVLPGVCQCPMRRGLLSGCEARRSGPRWPGRSRTPCR